MLMESTYLQCLLEMQLQWFFNSSFNNKQMPDMYQMMDQNMTMDDDMMNISMNALMMGVLPNGTLNCLSDAGKGKLMS